MAKLAKEQEVQVESANEVVDSVRNTGGNVTTTVVSSSFSREEDLLDRSLVKVKISYPKNYDGTKYFHDNQEYSMSEESANEVVKQGIGTIC